jgi:hypothetical protein
VGARAVWRRARRCGHAGLRGGVGEGGGALSGAEEELLQELGRGAVRAPLLIGVDLRRSQAFQRGDRVTSVGSADLRGAEWGVVLAVCSRVKRAVRWRPTPPPATSAQRSSCKID